MAVKHEVRIGYYESAVKALIEEGGQLIPSKDADGPFVLLKGSRVITYWPPDSNRRRNTMRLAEMVGYDPEIATGGRIVRHILDEVVQVNYKETYFHPKFRALAMAGWHWHYLYYKPGRHGYCLEFDLKSAYWAAFLSGQSCLLQAPRCWLEDNGALQELATLMESLPKAFRVQFLGCLASWRHDFVIAEKDEKGQPQLVYKENKNVRYGALFNAAHRAIYKVYKVMERAREIVGEDCVRVHTDGICCKAENGMPWESELFEYLASEGFKYTIKAQGDTYLWDVNLGFIGTKLIGPKRLLIDSCKRDNVKICRNLPPPAAIRPDVEMQVS